MEERETSAEIEDAAIAWAVRVDNAPLSQGEQAELDAWLAADTRRFGAYARASAMVVHAERTKALGPDFDPGQFAAAHADLAEPSPDAVETLIFAADAEPIAGRPTRRRLLVMGGSAVAAAAIGALAFSWQAAAHTYTTQRGEIRQILLADGSSITLGTASTIKVHLSSQARRVELVEGEALFDVAKDRTRPFIVAAGDTDVRAVGTSFSVRRVADSPVQVVVREGVVEVARPASPEVPPRRIGANMRAVAPDAAPMVAKPIPAEEVGRALAWRDGRLAFEDVPLRQAVAEFARYSDVKIAFADPGIGADTVTGLYAANDPIGFADLVAKTMDLRADRTAEGIVLRR